MFTPLQKTPKKIAKEISERFNPNELVPFPFENILDEENNLKIHYLSKMDSNISGVILHFVDDGFVIGINENKPEVRQYFTIAHELGHYYLHKELIKESKGLIDGTGTLDENATMFLSDLAKTTKIEKEANNFASVLIMPEKLVKKAWRELKNIEECAKVFGVSVSAMSIRLVKLNILE